MVAAQNLSWLPEQTDWAELLEEARTLPVERAFEAFQVLAKSRMDFVRAGKLDKAIERFCAMNGVPSSFPIVRLAVLGSSTLAYLSPSIRLGGLRRGIRVEVYTGEFGTYRQDLANPPADLHRFKPDYVLLCLDAMHAAALGQTGSDACLNAMRECWHDARARLGAEVIQQTVLPVLPTLMGNAEERLQQSPAAMLRSVNARLHETAEADGVHLLTIDTWASMDGLSQWYSPALWNRSKQEVHPRVSNLFGDYVGRLLGALRGRSAKCLVLDLDNTLWGGIIGDDGLGGIVLGQGSTVGEAHLALQRYALQLADRGVVLAVCSKNDLPTALTPFEQHSEMLLKREHISCFVANWKDKATNLRFIAQTLHLGLDALVFVDDNPAERALIRRELPMVHVPELPDDPADYLSLLASAGYFEATQITTDDRARNQQYRENTVRENLRASSSDVEGYLKSLRMTLIWSAFDHVGVKRIVQLANKTNQFNLTTRRYTEPEIEERMQDDRYLTLQLRLVDAFGDNGVIALLIGHRTLEKVLEIESWLMSCRVLGRRVEEAALSLLAEGAKALGCRSLSGTYLPTEKNGMVREMYAGLGFTLDDKQVDGTTRWILPLDGFNPLPVPMQIKETKTWKAPISTTSLPTSSAKSLTMTVSY